jgi:hypothetical protein
MRIYGNLKNILCRSAQVLQARYYYITRGGIWFEIAKVVTASYPNQRAGN